MGFETTLDISASGMDAQSERLRVIAENMANKDTTASTPGGDPYRRKIITFHEAVADGQTAGVAVQRISNDPAEFEQKYEPSHPAADANGYVKIPNVSSLVELMDMREAERSYSANLNVMQATRTMLQRTLELLK